MIPMLLGVSHVTAPVEVREKMALTKEQLLQALGMVKSYVGQAAILSTCNRVEVYATVPEARRGVEQLGQFLRDYHGFSSPDFLRYYYVHFDKDAVRHLLRVASGLDSMVLGEDQILGQIRQALRLAEAAGTAGWPLSNLLREALRVGKRARTETQISRYSVSVSSVGVEKAKQVLGDLGSRSVLIVSAGEMGKLAGKIVRDSGARRITVTSRTFQRAADLAARLGGQAMPFDRLVEVIADADIVISSTGASGFVLGPDAVAQAMSLRPQRPLVVIDIAVPRDVDPAVARIDNVHLFDIDDLQSVSQASLHERQREAVKAECIIDAEVPRLMRWWQTLKVVPTIAELRQRAEAICQREVAKTLKKMPDLSEEEQARLDAMTQAIVKKLLHHPITYLKKNSGDGSYLEMVRRLFNLDVAAPKQRC